jgi:hypothetical protein
MKTYNSMYLGICVNNNDPEKRGRVQVFIPHLMPTLYENWNQAGKDIKFNSVGDNVAEGLTSDVLDKLKAILPWAEAASPILGQSSPGNLLSSGSGGSDSSGGSGGFGGSGIPAGGGTLSVPGVGQVSGNTFDQSPVSSPTTGGAGGNALAQSALNAVGNVSTRNIPGAGGGNVGCAAAVSIMFKNATGQNILPGRSIVLGTGELYGHMSSNSCWQRVGFNQLAPGDVLVTARGSRAGHTGIYVGNGRIVSNSSKGFAGSAPGTVENNYNTSSWQSVINRNPSKSGAFRYVCAGAGGSGIDQTSVSGDSFSAPVHAKGTPDNLTDSAKPQQYGNPTNQHHTESSGTLSYPTAATSSGGNTQVRNFSGNNAQAYATMRAAAVAAGSPDPDTTASIAMFESGHLGSSMSRRANNPFGQTITQGQIGSNGIVGGTKGRDGQLHAVYDSLESAVKHHISRWGSNYVAGNTTATTNNMILGGYNSESKDGLAPGKYWQNGVLNRYNALSGQTAEAATDLSGAAPTGETAGEMTQGMGMSTTVVNNTDAHGAAPSQNLNGVAKGLFSYPAAGAMLWCFFREGNPLFPVYFACSYSQAEWQSAYRNVGQPSTGATNASGPGYNPVPQGSEPQSTGGIMNLNGVGGMRWEDTNDLANPTDSQKSIMFFGEDGSNLFFGRGYSQLLSKFDRRDQVEGDRWETTLGYKEQWVQGDYNNVIMGDQYIKVGNTGPAAVQAAQNIINKIKEIQAPLVEGGANTASGASSSSASSNSSPSSSNSIPGTTNNFQSINNITRQTGSGDFSNINNIGSGGIGTNRGKVIIVNNPPRG